MAEDATDEGMKLFRDARFGFVKVREAKRAFYVHSDVGCARTFNIPHACRCGPLRDEAPLHRSCDDLARPLSQGFSSGIMVYGTCREQSSPQHYCGKCSTRGNMLQVQPAQSVFLISTVGAGGMANGDPYIQRWADDNGNFVTRAISRPHVVAYYFERSLRVDT
jgi:hypothetical protein